jgi:hypothetical protein
MLHLAILALLAAASAAEPPASPETRVKVDYDKKVDFKKYRTFEWVPFQEPVSNPANHLRITRAVERELLARGLARAEPGGTADVFVHYDAKVEKKRLRTTSGPSEPTWQTTPDQKWTVSIELTKAEVGTLALELWDGQDRRVVWRAQESEVLRSPDQTEEQINEAVKRLLAAYPPAPEGRPE